MSDASPRLVAALQDRYRIERELGAGGMATVYLAEDLKHHRQVAIKVLKPELAAVLGAARFLNEIRTTANLQHPHILALHDSGEVDGTVFYVMPFVDGDSLRDRLNHEKQLPIDEAVRIAVEVAGALEYAHGHGVIHRDIKPENILLQGGHALVADFGIALAASRTDGGTRMTETGMSLGTPHYMSPEQAMGEREITAKSDVYALGCVVYEMLTGEPPFTGATAQAIVARVLTEEPRSLTAQRRTVPRHVEAAVQRSLSKLPADRYGSAAAFADALVNPASLVQTATVARAVTPVRRVPAWIWFAGTAAVAGTAAFLAGRATAVEQPRAVAQFTLDFADSAIQLSGHCCGNAYALSPDGQTLVLVPANTGNAPLYRRSIGQLHAEAIPGTEGGAMPFFSPDGSWLGFVNNGRGIRKVSLAGGPPLPVVNLTGKISEASWGDGDRIVYADDKGLWMVPAAGGQPTAVTPADSTMRPYGPSFLPGGKALLFNMLGATNEDTKVAVVDIASGRIDTIGPGLRPVYAEGYLVYAGSDRTLLAQPFDLSRRRTTGPAVAIIDGILTHGGGTPEFTLARDATGLVYQLGTAASSSDIFRLWSAGRESPVDLPGQASVFLEDPAFSPDGRRIAFAQSGREKVDFDIWILDRQSGTLNRFTTSGGRYPAWSPNGRELAWVSNSRELYVQRTDQSDSPHLIYRAPENAWVSQWLPDGKSILMGETRSGTGADIGMITIGDTTPRWLVDSKFHEGSPQVSHDGKWLAYSSNRTGRPEVYVQPSDGGGASIPVSTAGGTAPLWSPDDRTLYYVQPVATIVAVKRADGPGFQIAGRGTFADVQRTRMSGTNTNWALHPDGKQFLYVDPGGGGAGAPLVWVLNWPRMVKAIAKAR